MLGLLIGGATVPIVSNGGEMGTELVKGGTRGMTGRQRVFVEEYLRCWKAKEAALRAGYSEKNAANMGSLLLKRADVKGMIRERLAAEAMATEEVLARLAEQARGNLGEFLVIEEVDGREQVRFDWARLVREGKGHLLRAVTMNGARIEFYDAQAALLFLAKQLGIPEMREEKKEGLTIDDWLAQVNKNIQSAEFAWRMTMRAEIEAEVRAEIAAERGVVDADYRLSEG
jgi:hypothetical protein